MFKDINTKALFNKIQPFAEQDEEILSCGMFEAQSSLMASALTWGLSNRYHYIAVTSKRVLVLPLSKTTTKPIKEEVYSVSPTDVLVEKNHLIIQRPKDGKEIKFAFKFGLSALSGMNKEDFINALERQKTKK